MQNIVENLNGKDEITIDTMRKGTSKKRTFLSKGQKEGLMLESCYCAGVQKMEVEEAVGWSF